MSWEHNPVNEPEQFGFKRVVTVGELKDPFYDFYEFAVLEGEDGYYLSTDSGCSCPSPFESHDASDFTGPLTAAQVHEEVLSLWEAQTYDPVTRESVIADLKPVI